MNYTIFAPYLIGRIVLAASASMLSVALGWHLYQITGNPFDLALIGLVQIIPVLALFLVTGWVIDNFSRKKVLVSCALIETLSLIALAFVMNMDEVKREWVFGLLFLQGCGRAFLSPTVQAILPNLVPEQSLSKAVAMSSTAWNVASTAGPFLGGVLVAAIDLKVYWVFALLSSSAGIIFSFLPKLTQTRATGRALKQILGGIRFIQKSPVVLGSMFLDLLIILFGSVVALLPIYADDILKVGPTELGLMRAMPALGAVTVGIAMSRMSALRKAGRTLFISLLIFTGSIFLFAYAQSLWLAMAALWLYGASDMISVNVRSTLVQLATPDALRGRVSAVNSIFISTSNKMGDFRAGSVAAILPPVVTVALGGCCALGVVVAGYFMFPSIRKLDKLSDAKYNPDNEAS